MPNFQPDTFAGGVGKPILDKQKIIDIVKEEPPEKRVAKLVELGVLINMEGFTWGSLFPEDNGGRFFVFANVKGIPIPMYKSLFHTDNKREDVNFFIFFGILASKKWIIKGPRRNSNEFYGVKELEDVSTILTSVFDFDTSRKIEPEGEVIDGYIPEGSEIQNFEKLNELLGKKFDIDFSKLDVGDYNLALYYGMAAKKFFNELDRVLGNDR